MGIGKQQQQRFAMIEQLREGFLPPYMQAIQSRRDGIDRRPSGPTAAASALRWRC